MPEPEARDFVGYGRRAPRVRWPQDARVAVTFLVNYEAGAEYTFDGQSYRVRFLKFKHDERSAFPTRISVDGARRSLEINYSDIRLNAEIGEKAFEFPTDTLDGFARLYP